MSDAGARLKRRRTDAAGTATRDGYWTIAEEAYRLYIADGCDRTRVLIYWELAKERLGRKQPPSP